MEMKKKTEMKERASKVNQSLTSDSTSKPGRQTDRDEEKQTKGQLGSHHGL